MDTCVCVCVCLQAGDADDVVYADMVLPVVGDPARVPERESTEYASVRYT